MIKLDQTLLLDFALTPSLPKAGCFCPASVAHSKPHSRIVSDELLSVLQQIPGLHVAARLSAFSFKGKNATAQEIGEKLGVANLVEGSVRKSGKSVRITARLSRVWRS